MKKLKFIDLFAGLGGFHLALADLGHKCVSASELNEELRELYEKNHLEVWQEFLKNLGVSLSGRAFRFNLFVRNEQKGFPLQSLTQ